MQVLSVNTGKLEPLANAKTASLTGIYKRTLTGAVAIKTEGVGDDAIGDSRYHGGADQAVYLYGQPDYVWWEASLGQPLAPGTFGENLTLSDYESAHGVIGDRFHIGEVTLEVTYPRVPCGTLSSRMGDTAFLKKFKNAERPGVYCRVIRSGMVQAGDAVRYEAYTGGDKVTILELYRDAFKPAKDVATLRRHLASPLASRTRIDKEKLLAEIEAGGKK